MASFTPSVPFRPAPGLSNAHAQTMLAQVLRPLGTPKVRRERWDTPDGDFLDVDLLAASADAPHVLALHGLEGSSKSGYVRAILRHAQRLGWGALAMNFRSCSGEPNRLARSYSSGETDDPRFALRKLRESGVTGPLVGVGFSLGANVTLKMLAEDGENSPLEAAVAVSPPFSLATCADTLQRATGLGRVYSQVFLRALRAKALQKAKDHPGQLDVERIKAARTLQQFDDAVTAPMYGFKDSREYYDRCSSGPRLGEIRRPTLLITSEDDPITPLGGAHELQPPNPALEWLITQHGGHVGFIAGHLGRPHFWAEATAMEYLAHHLESRAEPRTSTR